jgi:hypothetical protein
VGQPTKDGEATYQYRDDVEDVDNPFDLLFNGEKVGTAQFDYPETGRIKVLTLADGYEVAFCVKGATDRVDSEWLVAGEFTDPAVETPSGNLAGVSNFAYVVRQVELPNGGEWCSPGFWSQNPLNAAAAADSEIDLGAPRSDWPRLGRNAPKQNPSINEVLAAPSLYGGGAFNYAGDLLSEAAGLVWTDTATADCPFAADASGKDPLTRNDA